MAEPRQTEQPQQPRRKKPNMFKNLALGFLFWAALLGIPYILFLSGKERINVLNPGTTPMEVTLIEKGGKTYTLKVAPNSHDGKLVKAGEYTAVIKDAGGKEVRSISSVMVSDKDGKGTYIDTLGRNTYMVVDITGLYEGNEKAGTTHIETADSSKAMLFPDGTDINYFGPDDVIPAKIDRNEKPRLLVPLETGKLKEMTEEQVNEAVGAYIEKKAKQAK